MKNYKSIFIFILLLIYHSNIVHSVPNPCKQKTLLGDWGFWDLQADQPSPWELDINNVEVSFVESLEDGFADTTVYGFYGIKFDLNNDLSATVSLNTSFEMPARYANGTQNIFSFQVKVSSVNSELSMSVLLNNLNVKKFTSFGDYSQQTFNVPIPYDFILDITNNISISFYLLDRNTVYVDDIKILIVPNNTLLTHQEIYVSNNGSDIEGDGSLLYPFASVQQAIIFLGEGSLIIVMPGNYCGLGNSWIDPSVNNLNVKIISDTSYETRPIFSGESLTNIISFESWDEIDLFVVQGIIFKDTNTKPNGALIEISGTEVTFFNCDFYQTSPTNQTIFLNYLNSSLFYNCSFYASTNGYLIQSEGVIGNDYLTIIGSTFYSDSPLDLLKIDYVFIENSMFFSYSNTLTQCSIIIDMIKSINITDSYFEVTYCLIQSNMTSLNSIYANVVTQSQSVLLFQDSSVYMESCVFKNFTGPSLIQAFRGDLSLYNCDIIDSTYASCIQVQSGSFNFTSSVMSGAGIALDLESSQSTITDCSFVDLSTFLTLSQSTIILTNCLVYNSSTGSNTVFESTIYSYSNHFSNNQENLFILASSIFYDNNSSFFDNEGAAFIYSKGSEINLVNTKLYDNSDQSIIVLTDGSVFNAFGIVGYNNYADRGSIITTEDIFEGLNIANSTFYQNSGYLQGGVIYSEGMGSITATNINATCNYSPQGAVFALISEGTSLFIYNGSYTNNTASEGSVVYYLSSAPVLVGNVIMKYNQDYLGGGDTTLGKACLTNLSSIPSTIESGSNITITFQLVDSEGNHLTNKTCTRNCLMYFFIAGSLMQTIPIGADGSVVFTNVVLKGPIGSRQPIIVYSNDDAVDPFKTFITFDPCSPGYLPESNGQICEPCESGTYGINGLNCSVCPENIACLGGNGLYAESGYWMYFNSSQDILEAYECPPDVCLDNNQCAQNYQGPLCSECIEGYSNCGSGCKYEDSIDMMVVLFKLVFFIVLVLAQQLSSDSSGLIPIGLYFMQTLVVISSGVKFSILSVLSGATSSSTRTSNKDSVLSYLSDCIGPYGFYWNHYFVMAQPVILVVILCIIILIEFIMRSTGILFEIPILKSFVDKSNREFRHRQFSAFIKVCMNSYGPFITEMLLILFCTPVGPYDLLTSNPGIQCFGISYKLATETTWTLFPIIVLFPTVIFILLRKVRNRLDDKGVERKLGVFYLKYKPKFYFWDVLLLFKRFSIVILSMLEFESSVRSISLVFLCLFYLFLQVKYQPFLSGKDNYLETISLTLLFISCIYLDNSLWDITGQWILIASIVIFIIAAIKLQGHYYWKEFKTKSQPVIIKIKEFFSCCFSEIKQRHQRNKKKLVDYTSEDEEDDDYSNEYTDDSDSTRYIGKVDQRNLLSNTFSTTYYEDD